MNGQPIATPRGGPFRRSALALAAALTVAPGAALAGNDAQVDATYSASLGGFPVASGSLSFVVSGGQYRASIGAQVTGFATLVANRSATASAAGKTGGGNTSSQSYNLAINGGPAPNVVAMSFSGGNVTSLQATEVRPAPDRIPLTPAHKRGVIDPLAAFVISVPNGQDPVGAKVCNRTLKVFDGRIRYDLRLVYGARGNVRGAGYSGPSITCAVAYRPIAGYRQLSSEQNRFERNIEFSITFVPVGSTNVLIPYKVVVGTPMGLLVVQASSFDVKGSRTAEIKSGEKKPADEQ